MTWIPREGDSEDAYWEEQRQREKEKERTNPHTLERWFRRSIATYVKSVSGIWWRQFLTESLLDWYWAHRGRFLVWTDTKTYSGEGWATGSWSIDEAKLGFWFRIATLSDNPRKQMDYFLDEMLPDRHGQYRGLPIPSEPSASSTLREGSQLPVKERERRLRALERLRDRWPRACEKCGEVFVPTTRKKARAVTVCEGCTPGRRHAHP